jgi:hypothetical protein
MSTLLLLILVSFLTLADFLIRVNGLESEVKVRVRVSFVSYVDDDHFAQSVFNQIAERLNHAHIVLDPLAQTNLPSITVEISQITNQ